MIAAVCAAPSIFAVLVILEGKRATVHPDFVGDMGDVEVLDEPVVVDGNIITGQGLGATIPFALRIVEIMVGESKAEQIKKQFVISKTNSTCCFVKMHCKQTE